MFNQVTYNVLIERFKAFADGHYKIERFSHGQIDVTDISKDQRFPWMHVVPVSIQPSGGSRSFTLDVVFADMPRDKEQKTEYQRESLSDCIQLAEDLLAEIKNGGVIFGEDVTLEEGSAVQPFMEEYTHVLTGVTLSLTITFPWNWSACDIPADWTTGGSSSGGGGGIVPSLVLKVNNVDNVIQDVLDLVNGTNITIVDLGDGRVQINSTGGITSVSWGDIIGNIADQLDLAMWFNEKADVSSLAEVAFTGDYTDLLNPPIIPPAQVNSDWDAVGGVEEILNKPTIPDASTFVPYTGATSNVNLGVNSFIADDGSDNSKMSPTLFGVQNSDTTKYSYLEKAGLTVTDSGAGQTMNVNAGGLTFPDASSQYTAAVNADWNATSGLAEILNKPTIPPVIGDMTKAVYDTDADGVVDSAERVQIVVRNQGSATLLKGQVVYLSGATGNRPNAVLADASTEATSSKTIGLVIADIGGNSDGQIAVNGTLHDLDTSAFNGGDTLWLSETAGEVQANTPPAEPAHAVFIGYVARSHPNFGRVVLAIQNGYELNELHGVRITSQTTGDVLYYDGSLWVNQSLDSNVVVNSSGVSGASVTDALDQLDANKVDANTPILSGTATKVVYDSKGLITTGGLLAASDIPFGVDAIRIGTGVVSNTEFGFLDGVGSSIQTQLNGKVTSNTPITPQTATKISYDAKGLVTGGAALAASDMPSAIDAARIGNGNVSNTEFQFLDGVTSSIQTQINSLSLPTLNTVGTAVAPVQVNAITATSCNLSLSLPSGTADRTYYIEACWAIQPSFNPTSGARVGFLWSGSIINFHGVYQGSQSEIAFRNGQVISLGNGSLFPSNTPYLANDITRNATAPTIFRGYCQVVAASTTTLTLALATVTVNQTISFQPRGSYLRAIRVN
jgi:hypothetical protein